MKEEDYMRMAIGAAEKSISDGQTPFGACIVKDDVVLACEHNRVWKDTDITAHAEIVAIRKACKMVGDIDLSGAVLYSTCEPCPMCLAAAHWARIGRVVYGASISDAREAGFNEMTISNDVMVREGQSPLLIQGGFLKSECAGLFKAWLDKGQAKTY